MLCMVGAVDHCSGLSSRRRPQSLARRHTLRLGATGLVFLLWGIGSVAPAQAACNNVAGNFTAPVVCSSVGTTNLVLPGPSTVTVNEAAGTQAAVLSEVTGNSGSANATISDVTVVNNDTTYPSIGIYTLVSPGASTGNGTLTLSGTNSVTTANGTSVEVNVRGTGAATTNITGVINVTGLIANSDDNDGIETTTHNGGAATLNMGTATGTIALKGGNGILIDSLAGGGNVTGEIGAVTINLDNTIAGANNALNANSGIFAYTQALGTIEVTTAANIGTIGSRADGIKANAVRGSIVLTNTGDLTTTGNNSRGIELTTVAGANGGGGTITATNGGIIQTAGATSAGILATSTNGALSITNNGAITTTGLNSRGIELTSTGGSFGPGGAITAGNFAAIQTSGQGSAGILATSTDGNLLVTNGGAISTTGREAYGIQATNAGAGIVTVSTTANVAAIGQFSVGVEAFGSTTNLTVDAGVTAFGGWQADLAGVGVNGLPSAGVAIGSRGGGATLTNNGAIGALSDRAIVELDRFGIGVAGPLTIINNGNVTGYLQLGAGNSTFQNLTADSFDIRHFADTDGDGVPDTKRVAISDFGAGTDTFENEAGGVVRLAPVSGAAVTDATGYYVPTTGIDSRPLEASFYDFNRDGLLQGQLVNLETFDNVGVIDLRGSVTGNTLVITANAAAGGAAGSGVFISDGGQLLLNTRLNDGIPLGGQTNSYSDMLIVDGTQLGEGGPTAIGITLDPESAGALTTGNGIALVEVRNKQASADGVFVLGDRVASGAYEYTLYHNGIEGDDADGNWYLRSELIPPDPPDPPTPDYRDEVPADSVLPALVHDLGQSMLGTYHDRVGTDYPEPQKPAEPIFCKDASQNFRCTPTPEQEAVYADVLSPASSVLWGRIFGKTGNVDVGSDSIAEAVSKFEEHGPSYDYSLGGLQVGTDLLRQQDAGGTRDVAGLYVGLATARAEVEAVLGDEAGEASATAYAIGGYWTRSGDEGWYLDAVVQGTFNQLSTRTLEGQNLDTEGWAFAGSIEAGYPFHLGEGWSLEPQAQLIYQIASINDAADDFGTVSFDDSSAAYGRVGVRLAKDWETADHRAISTWAHADLWSTFDATATTTFASLAGTNPVSLPTDLGGTWATVGLGLSGQLNDSVTLFGTADYSMRFDDAEGQSYGGQAGVRVRW